MAFQPVSHEAMQLTPSRTEQVRPLSALRDQFEQAIRLAIEADPRQPIAMAVSEWPGLRRTQMISPLTARMARPAPMLADGEDSVCLMINTGGSFGLRQLGREAFPDVGEAVLLSYREAAVLEFSSATYRAVRVPAATLPFPAEERVARPIPRDTEAMGLLRSYLAAMPAHVGEPRLQRLAAEHLCDLVALTIGAGTERRPSAGARAARLEAMKAAIVARPSLTVADLAARQGVSPRYVQLLFEEAGLTVSGFALDCRLERARGMLTSPRHDGRSVASIAFDSGFADLSYFNRSFKRRYHASPGELRAESRAVR